MSHSLITEETLAPLKARIGKRVERTTMPFYTEINADAARHFANAIGDNNPLHTDTDYGGKTRWKGQLAPPTILYSTNNALSGAVEGLPGVHAMFAGTEFDWTGPIRVGTRIRTEVVLKDLVEHKTRFAGRAIQQIYTVKIFDRDKGTLLCSADSWCFRARARHEVRQGT
jgi:acyl dehydratase